MLSILANIGAIISLLLGVLGAVWPQKVEKFVSIKGVGREGLPEIRATYGGFFAGISLFAILTQEPTVFLALGFGWAGAALVRTVTLFFGSLTQKNVAGIAFEAIIAALCLSILFS